MLGRESRKVMVRVGHETGAVGNQPNAALKVSRQRGSPTTQLINSVKCY